MGNTLTDKLEAKGLMVRLSDYLDLICDEIKNGNRGTKLSNVNYIKDMVQDLELLCTEMCTKSLLVLLTIYKEENSDEILENIIKNVDEEAKQNYRNIYNIISTIFTKNPENDIETEYIILSEIYENIYDGYRAITELKEQIKKPYRENEYIRNESVLRNISTFLKMDYVNPLRVLINEEPLDLFSNEQEKQLCPLLLMMRDNRNLFKQDSPFFDRMFKLVKICTVYESFYYILEDILLEEEN